MKPQDDLSMGRNKLDTPDHRDIHVKTVETCFPLVLKSINLILKATPSLFSLFELSGEVGGWDAKFARVGSGSANVSGTAGFRRGKVSQSDPPVTHGPPPFFFFFFLSLLNSDEIMELSTCWRGKREEVGGQ